MQRRKFIALLGGAAATWPLAAQAQQAVLPLIGYLSAATPEANAHLVTAFRGALAEVGYVENQNATIEYRYAAGQNDRLPELAKELVRRQPVVIVATPNANAARAVKAASSTTPLVFMVGDDPVKFGLVASLNHPGGNATGVNFFISELTTKRLGLLHELLPTATRFAALVNPNEVIAGDFIKDLTAADSTLGVHTEIVRARDSSEIEAAFATFANNKVDGVMVAPDSLFVSQRAQIVALSLRHDIPAIYTVREYVDAGGLMSYGPSVTDMYRQLAFFVGRILKGEKPADLPVQQPTKFDLTINLKTARVLHLELPPKVLALADEVIE